jgi:hypothetical protein
MCSWSMPGPEIEPIPDDIALWLDKLAKAHAKVGIPQNYKGVQLKMKIGKYAKH